MRNNAHIAEQSEKPNPAHDLRLLRMELSAIRDRVVGDLDAAIAKIDSVLPADESYTAARMRTWGRDEWREFMESAPRPRRAG
jgi:hypothetical protein